MSKIFDVTIPDELVELIESRIAHRVDLVLRNVAHYMEVPDEMREDLRDKTYNELIIFAKTEALRALSGGLL